MRVGVESAHSFGDALFNLPLIKAIGEQYSTAPYVAVRPAFKDAFYNIPWVGDIVEIANMGDGAKALRQLGCQQTFQITQNIKFFEFREHNPEHSLIDTPTETGHQLGLVFDPRPIFRPTSDEITRSNELASDQPTIAIEASYKSGQSWADAAAIQAVVDKYLHTHRILWLSHTQPPAGVPSLTAFTRRELIMALRFADIFFSVGSGFFCASQALPTKWQPDQIVCLWLDDLYRYEKRLAKLCWFDGIIWIHNSQELSAWLNIASPS